MAVSTAPRAPLMGLRRRFWPLSLVTRMRSTVGLKSKPKEVPERGVAKAAVETGSMVPLGLMM